MADETSGGSVEVKVNLTSSPNEGVSAPLGSAPSEIGVPLGSWVKGGTSTSSFDKELAQNRFDVAERHREDLQSKQEAQNPGPGGLGDSFSHSFSGFDPAQRPCCHVKMVNSRKEETGLEMLVDVTLDLDGKLQLTFVCPDCVERGVHQSFAQQTARDDHRAWFLDTSSRTGAGMPFQVINAWGHVETHISAGEIMDTDTLRCSNAHCTFACKIHKNLMYRV
jgi:hypothetical protein